MSISWCYFNPKIACPGGLKEGTGICASMAEEDPDFKFSCQWYVAQHLEETKEYQKQFVGLTEEEKKERIRTQWQKLMQKANLKEKKETS